MDARVKNFTGQTQTPETAELEELKGLEAVLREQLSRLRFFERKKKKTLKDQLDELREKIAGAEDRQGERVK